LNSTGRVIIVNTTDNPKRSIPRLIIEFPITELKLNNIPRKINGIESVDPKFASGTITVLNVSGTYPLAC